MAGLTTRVAERPQGRISRTLVLDREIDGSTARARYEDGLLRLVLPKKRLGQARTLVID